MEKTSKTFGQRFLAAFCALAMLLALYPQGAFAAAQQPGPTAAPGTPGTEAMLAVPTAMPAPTATPAPTVTPEPSATPEPTTTPVQEPAAGDPAADMPEDEYGVMPMALDNVSILGDDNITATPGETLAGKELTLTALTDGDPVGAYSWSIESGGQDFIEFDGEPGDATTATVKAIAPGTATVKVTCDDKEATHEIKVVQQYLIKEVTYTGENVTYGAAADLPSDKITVTLNPAYGEIKATATVPAGTGVGQHNATVTYTGDDEWHVLTNKDSVNTVNVTIDPKEVTLTGVKFAEKTYDKTKTVTATGYTFDSTYNDEPLGVKEVTFEAGSENAGDQTVIASGSSAALDSNNYKLTGDQGIVDALNMLGPDKMKINIAKKPVDLTVTGVVTHISDGQDKASEEEITDAERNGADGGGFTCTVADAVDGESLTAKVQAADAAGAWTFGGTDPATDLPITNVAGTHFTLAAGDGGAADPDNYTINSVNAEGLKGTITAKPSFTPSLDTTSGSSTSLTVDNSKDVTVTFNAGTTGTDGKTWYNSKNEFGLDSGEVKLYTAQDGKFDEIKEFSAETDLIEGSGKQLSLFIKATSGAANGTVYGPVAVTYNYDKTAPTFDLKDVQIKDTLDSGDFAKDQLIYTVAISDTGESNIDLSSIQYAVNMTKDPAPVDGWIEVTPVEDAEECTVTVTAPAMGYLFLKASDNAGNEKISEAIRPLVVEDSAPTVTVALSEPVTGANPVQQQKIKWTVDDTVGGSVKEHSGIDTVTLTLLDMAAGEPGTEMGATGNLSGEGDVNNELPNKLEDITGDRVTLTDKETTVSGLSGKYKLRVTATDFCGNTQSKTSDEFILDNTAPAVAVTMAGGRTANDTFYYNMDNCALTVTVTDDYLAAASGEGSDKTLTVTLKDTEDKELKAIVKLVEGTETTETGSTENMTVDVSVEQKQATVTFPADTLTAEANRLADGEITVTVQVTDRAGNTSTTIQPVGEDQNSSKGVAVSGSEAAFVLDTTAPQVTKIATNQEGNAIGDKDNHYYYNQHPVEVEFTISDADSLGEDWIASYTFNGVQAQPESVNQKVTDAEPDKVLTLTLNDEGAYTDITVSGHDLAGNQLTLALRADKDPDDDAEDKGDGNITLKAAKILDFTAPAVTVKMAGGKEDNGTFYYKADNCGLTVTATDKDMAGDETSQLQITLADSARNSHTIKVPLTDDKNNTPTPENDDDLKDPNHMVTASLSHSGEATTVTVTIPASVVKENFADGTVTVTVDATDEAGNDGNTVASAGSDGVAVTEGKAAFVLDTVAPVLESIVTNPTAPRDDVDGTGHYFYKQPISIEFKIEDVTSNHSGWPVTYSLDGGTPQQHPEALQETETDGEDTLTLTLSAEGVYSGITISGTDLAGNPLTLAEQYKTGGPEDDVIDDPDTAEQGSFTLAGTRILDMTDPVVTVSMADGRAVDDVWYYRADNCGLTVTATDKDMVGDLASRITLTLTSSGAPDAPYTATFPLATETPAQNNGATATVTHEGSTTVTVTVPADVLAANLADGTVTVAVTATDEAGNSAGIAGEGSAGMAVTGGSGTFVLDTVAPQAELALLPGEGVKDTAAQTNSGTTRYYYSGAFTAALTVRDANLSPEFITFAFGQNFDAGQYATGPVAADTPADVLTLNEDGSVSGALASSKDGLYIYSVAGTDRAGNPLVLAESDANRYSIQHTAAPFTTYAVAVDTVAPVATVTIDDFYKAVLDGTSYAPQINRPYQQKAEATVSLTTQDASPVTLSYHVGSSQEGAVADIAVGPAPNVADTHKMDGQQIFTLENLSVSDLAGNISVKDGATNKFYLDIVPPEEDQLAPTVQLTAIQNGMGHSTANVDLYDASVSVRAVVRDPYPGISASGLYHVYYKVLADGADMTGAVGVSGKGTAGSGIVSYGTAGHTLDEGTGAYDEGIVCDDTLLFTFDAGMFNYNDVTLAVWAEDNSGNILPEGSAAFYRFGIDTTAPTVRVDFDNNDAENEKYFKAPRTATVTVTERNFDPALVKINTEVGVGSGWQYAAGGANGDADTWTNTITYDEDGDYTLDISASDIAGHDAGGADYGNSVAPQEFTIDLTAPVIEVTFDNNNAQNVRYYDAARTATVTIREHNFSAGDAVVEATAAIQEGTVSAPPLNGWQENGDNNIATLAFTEDGDFAMNVSYVDLAGNEAEEVSVDLFTIDTTPPELEIGGVEDHVAYNGEVAPSITYHDINYDSASAQVTITGYEHTDGENLQGVRTDDAFGGSLVCENIPALKENDDVYTATGFVSDLAGNTSEATIVFSVNRFGSTYMLGEQTRALVENYYTNQPQDLHITEINVSELVAQSISVSLNGDLAQLRANVDYTVQQSNPGWSQYDYTVHAANFEREGAYTVTLYSEDDAANTNTNQAIRENDGGTNTLPIEFLVDMTAPVLMVTGVEDGERYVDTERTLMVDYQDNTALAGLSLYVGNDHVADYSAEELRNAGGKLEYTAKAANDWQALRVTAVDAAGNSAETVSGRFLLTDNLWVQYINNTPLLIGSAGGAGGLGLLIFLLARRRRKNAA